MSNDCEVILSNDYSRLVRENKSTQPAEGSNYHYMEPGHYGIGRRGMCTSNRTEHQERNKKTFVVVPVLKCVTSVQRTSLNNELQTECGLNLHHFSDSDDHLFTSPMATI